MSPSTQRRASIVDRLESAGSVSVAELVDEYGVSEMTIRRDLAELEKAGVLRRFHGGALIDRRRSYEPPYLLRERQNTDAKRSLAVACADLIGEGESVAIGYGTTALEVARALTTRSELTVITPSLRAALDLAEAPGIRVLLSGGVLRPGELSLIGRDSERTFERHFVDTAIIGAAGVDASYGLTDFHLEEVAVTRALLARAKRTIVVADDSKLGVVAFASVAGLRAVDVLVTNVEPADPRLAELDPEDVHVVSVTTTSSLEGEADAAEQPDV